MIFRATNTFWLKLKSTEVQYQPWGVSLSKCVESFNCLTTFVPLLHLQQVVAKTAGHFQSSTHANHVLIMTLFCFQHRPRPEWRELCPGPGQIWQQLHQPGQPRPGNRLRQVLLPHQGAVCPTEEPGEFNTQTLKLSVCVCVSSCPHMERKRENSRKRSYFFPVFTSISGLGFGFKGKIRITLGEGLTFGM